MANQEGIKETRDLVVFAGTLVSNIADAANDGKFDWWEAAKFKDSAAAIPAAIQGIKTVPDELSDLSEEEVLELNNAFRAALDLKNEVSEELVERGVTLALGLTSYINDLRAATAPPPATV